MEPKANLISTEVPFVTKALLFGFLPKHQSLNLGHFQVGSYRYRRLVEGVYTL